MLVEASSVDAIFLRTGQISLLGTSRDPLEISRPRPFFNRCHNQQPFPCIGAHIDRQTERIHKLVRYDKIRLVELLAKFDVSASEEHHVDVKSMIRIRMLGLLFKHFICANFHIQIYRRA